MMRGTIRPLYSNIAKAAAILLAVLTLVVGFAPAASAAGGPPPSITIGETLAIADGRTQITVICQASDPNASYPVGVPVRIAVRQTSQQVYGAWRGNVACSASGEGTAVVIAPQSGRFRPGNARVAVTGTAYDPATGETGRYVFVAETVKLVRSVGIG